MLEADAFPVVTDELMPRLRHRGFDRDAGPDGGRQDPVR